MKSIFYPLIFTLSFFTSYSQEETQNLSYFLFPKFVQGDVLMKNGVTNHVLLNYNSLNEEMIFEEKGEKLAISNSEIKQIDMIVIQDRKFLPMDNKFIELIYDSKNDLYAEHKCDLIYPGKSTAYGGTSQTSAITSNSAIYSKGKIYGLKLPDNFKTKPYTYYWLKKDGKMKRFINTRQLMKLYNDKDDLFKAYTKEHDVNYENPESIVKLVDYLETNK